MTPEELKKNPPRNVQYSDHLFKQNRKKVKAILVGSVFVIPLVALIFWWKFDDFIPGIFWGAGIATLGELIGVALMMNAKKAVSICQNGSLTHGTVTKSAIHGNTGKYTTADSAGYVFITVTYREKLGRELNGMVTFIGSKKEIDLKEGDNVPVLYLAEKPESFILYSDSLGISTIGRSKFA